MSKLISFVCVLALASISYGAGTPMFNPPPATMLAPGDPDGGVLVGDWEDHFDFLGTGSQNVMLGFSKSTGVTRNATALKAVGDAGGWAWALALKLDGYKHSDYTVWDEGPKQVCPSGYANNEAFLDWLLVNDDYDTFEMDVTTVSTDWVEDTDPLTDPYVSMFIVINSGGFDNDGNWGGVWGQQASISTPLDATTRVAWDFSQAKQDTIDLYATYCNDRYFEIFIYPDNGGYIDATYYMDNARIVPEPATIALLGLGALSLIRRKR